MCDCLQAVVPWVLWPSSYDITINSNSIALPDTPRRILVGRPNQVKNTGRSLDIPAHRTDNGDYLMQLRLDYGLFLASTNFEHKERYLNLGTYSINTAVDTNRPHRHQLSLERLYRGLPVTLGNVIGFWQRSNEHVFPCISLDAERSQQENSLGVNPIL